MQERRAHAGGLEDGVEETMANQPQVHKLVIIDTGKAAGFGMAKGRPPTIQPRGPIEPRCRVSSCFLHRLYVCLSRIDTLLGHETGHPAMLRQRSGDLTVKG